jgi:hypothetical protein
MKTEIEKFTKLNGIDNFITNWKTWVSSQIQLKSKSNARRNLPNPYEDHLIRYVGFLKELVQDCIRSLDKQLKVAPLLFDLFQLKAKSDKVVFETGNRKDELETELLSLRSINTRHVEKLSFYYSITVFILLCLLGIAEAVLSYKAFKYLTGSSIGSVIIASVFGVAWIFLAEKLAELLEKSSGTRKIFMHIVAGIGCTSVFYLVAHLRALEKASSRAIINHEALPSFFDVNLTEVVLMTFLGWIFFIAGFWLAQKTPSIQELKQLLINRSLNQNIQKIETEMAEIESQINAINDEVERKEREVLSILNTRKQSILEIEGYLYLEIEAFKEVNFQYRPDGQYPRCFNEKLVFELDSKIPDLKEDIQYQMQNSTFN